jgi:hypothetical protein
MQQLLAMVTCKGYLQVREEGRGRQLSKTNIIVAKNYLNEEELSTLNLIVSQYLDFAELQARGRKPMYMADWKAKLDRLGNSFFRAAKPRYIKS